MTPTEKLRAGIVATIAGLAVVIGGASIAQGETTSSSAAPAAAPSYETVQDAAPQERPDRDRDGRPCPEKDGGGSGSSNEQQQAPAEPTAPSTTTPSL